MKRLLYIILTVLFTASCSDYLEVTSLSSVDESFLFGNFDEADKVMMGIYGGFRDSSDPYANGMFYNVVIGGSDTEWHPETYTSQPRHREEGLNPELQLIDYYAGMFNEIYNLSNRLAIVMKRVKEQPAYQSAVAAGQTNAWTQLYGEAVGLHAVCYFELTKYYGDVPYFDEPVYTNSQIDGKGLMSRFDIYDHLIANLKEAETNMYHIGQGGITAERINRTFVQALIGRIAMFSAGYSTLRTDFEYGLSFEQKGSEQWGAIYARRTDYRGYYEIAKEYLEKCVNNTGTAKLLTTDERGYNNPFQRHFQYMMDLEISPESLYEIGETQGGSGNTEYGYAFGRPSSGGNNNAYNCKVYGQSRFYPVFYYEWDNADLRKDVSITITANKGDNTEVIISFLKGETVKGGPANNKWDEGRMKSIWTQARRKSGINDPYFRMADAVLLLAEAYAVLGEEGSAKAELTKIRSRAFAAADQAAKVTGYINGLSGAALLDAIIEERKFEFAGEGRRRYDLIRTGKFPEAIKKVRDAQRSMVAGLEANGYYTFSNGNVISDYIWTKRVNTADYGMSNKLTVQCDVSPTDQTYPIKYPSWRGTSDIWSQFTNVTGERNLAIQGLFERIDAAKAAALEADGYTKVAWGADIIREKVEHIDYVFVGYPDTYYNAGYPPRYIMPINSTTILQSKGLITNGYGFKQTND
ncbi:MAG: RagB/SusD family nutrient uptake outer membrane protein [Bacteroidales bacterium]|jgi:hypothetical protein|nr:RagB/SusD family nutrient uptake outer membrane protein [Bacteroidales bacterium]